MKRSLVICLATFLLAIVLAVPVHAIRTMKLLDKTYQSAECLVLCANPDSCKERLCHDIDAFSAGFEKHFDEQLDVYPSGEIAVFIQDKKGVNYPYGGIDPAQDIFFYPKDNSEPIPIGDGIQVFQPGTVRLSFLQPYDDLYRREMDMRVIVYFYAHTEDDLEKFRQIRVRDSQDFEDYKSSRINSVSHICDELKTSSLKPQGCLTDAERRIQNLRSIAPSLNQSDTNKQKPTAHLDKSRINAFTNQAIDITLLSIEDPDHQCDEFQYLWDNTEGAPLNLQVDELGNLRFIASEAGDYMLRFRLKEDCTGHTLTSDPIFVPIKIISRNTLFPDLAKNHPDYEYLLDLYSLGVIQGYPDGTVRPNKLVGRAEFLKMLFETAHVDVPESAFSYAFPDTRDGEWYSKYVFYAKNLDIIEGYPDNSFRPTGPVNLAEALKMMLQITDIELKENLNVWFGDVDITDWFSRYIQTAYREGILDNIQPQQNVNPGRLLTRGEVARLLVRTFIKPINRLNLVNVNKLK